jgi:hypothetical protein
VGEGADATSSSDGSDDAAAVMADDFMTSAIDDFDYAAGSAGRFGISVGMLAPGGDDAYDYAAGPELGVFWQRRVGAGPYSVGLEVHYARLASADGASTSDVLSGGAAVQWDFAAAGPSKVYALGGLSVLGESARAAGDVDGAALLSVDLGIGAALSEKADARAAVLLLTNSANASSVLRLSFGVLY